jgi:hypothetical protein
MNENSNSGFMQRWSRRKAEARLGKVPAAEPAAGVPPPWPTARPASDGAAAPLDPPVPPPTLDDVHQLTPTSDFSTFVRHEVPAEVKNAAMKKLFADPHFNVMDGLDVYIDDYSQPDPLAPTLLRQMASAQFLNLTDEPQEQPSVEPMGGNSLSTGLDSVMQGAHCPSSETLDHDHTDLRLQPDSSTRRPDTGPASV